MDKGNTNMSSVRPIVAPPVVSPKSENAPHYGVLMGGPKVIKLEGVGDASVGHLSIPRRTLAEFTHIYVGRSFEGEQALADDVTRPGDWSKNPDRIRVKTPKECAGDVFKLFGQLGFTVPNTLIGKPYAEAVKLFEMVMPKSDNLMDVMKELSSVSYDDERESLREELLQGAQRSFDYINMYSSHIASEVANAPKTGHGKARFDQLDEEYFRELKKPLPEEVPAIATLAMGKEIATSLKNASTSDELLKAILEQNQLLREQMTSRQEPTVVTEPVKPAKAGKTAGTKQEEKVS